MGNHTQTIASETETIICQPHAHSMVAAMSKPLPRLRSNILALGAVQAGNFVVPLLALPYLARTLGAEAYGQTVWVQTIMLFGVLWVDFGFGWSATRNISMHRHDVLHVSQVFSSTWSVQWLLAVFFLFVSSLAVLVLQVAHPLTYMAGLGMVLGQVLMPMWLFQGLEALRAAAVIQLAGKLLTLPLVFIWVQGPDDQLWALLFYSTSSVLVGVFSLLWIRYQGWVRWHWPSAHSMWLSLSEASILFFSRALISLYTTLVPLAVGWWAGATELAYFNLADRMKSVVQALLMPVSQALFPRMSWLFQNDTAQARDLLRKTAWGVSLLSGLAGVVLWIGAQPLMVLVGGEAFSKGATVLQWLAFVPCVVALSNLMGVQIMLPLGMNQAFTLILGMASVLCLLGLFPMISQAGAEGAAQLVLLVECVVTGSMAVFLARRGRLLGKQ